MLSRSMPKLDFCRKFLLACSRVLPEVIWPKETFCFTSSYCVPNRFTDSLNSSAFCFADFSERSSIKSFYSCSSTEEPPNSSSASAAVTRPSVLLTPMIKSSEGVGDASSFYVLLMKFYII